MSRIIIIVICLAICITSSGQINKVKFGKVSLSDLEMNVYEKDSSANAVILFDIGKFSGRDIKFTRHLRVKILKKSGLSWGNWSFNTPSKSTFKVVVNNLENAEIITEKVTSENVYEEDVIDNFSIYKVFAPNVKVGSVIDIKYSHFGLPFEWRFQYNIPVKYNELEIEESDFLTYNKEFVGFEPIQALEDNLWIAEDMPAFKKEPFLSNYSNYVSKFQFQLVSLGTAGYSYQEVSTTWEKVRQRLLENDHFGEVLNRSTFLNDYVREIRALNLSVDDQIQAAFDTIQKHLKWNGQNKILAEFGLKSKFKTTHSANSAEINLLLIALLNKLNIKTLPVVLSTRENGYLRKNYASIDRLNYVIGYIEDKELLLDGTSLFLKPGILPQRCLNLYGLVIDNSNDAVEWVELNPGYKDMSRQLTVVNIKPDGTADGVLSISHDQYDYLEWIEERKLYDNNNSIYLNEISEKNQLVINNYEIVKDVKSKLTSTERFEIDLSDELIDTGDELIVSPILIHEYSNNPFKTESRKYPVDIFYPKSISSIIRVNFPETYKIGALPKSSKFSLSGGGAIFTYLTNSSEKRIDFKIGLEIKKSVFTADEYLALKRFFAEVSKKINQPIELVKND